MLKKKYKTPTMNINLKLEACDWQILDDNSTIYKTVTDQVQEAIKDYIRKHYKKTAK